MQYIQYIEESKTWTCPKSGIWKVICVGGGATACLQSNEAAGYLGFQGGSTSFGAYVSADGGIFSNGLPQAYGFGGQSGFDGINYGSTPVVKYTSSGVGYAFSGGASLPTYGTGFGYGASGGLSMNQSVDLQFTTSNTNNNNGNYQIRLEHHVGTCGKIKSAIIDLADGEVIACTVGKGGDIKSLSNDDAKIKEILYSMMRTGKTYSITDLGNAKTFVNDYMSNGADGVIILQYLGESM